jgi:hypothetical protein
MHLSIIRGFVRRAADQAAGAPPSVSSTPLLASLAATALTLITASYEFGRWRERATSRDQVVLAGFAGIERRLTTIEDALGIIAARHAGTERWQGRVETRLEICIRRLNFIERDRPQAVA